jgi:hypothetical protein
MNLGIFSLTVQKKRLQKMVKLLINHLARLKPFKSTQQGADIVRWQYQSRDDDDDAGQGVQ